MTTLYKRLLPVVLLVVGSCLGWIFGQRTAVPETPAEAAAEAKLAPGTAEAPVSARAPEGGFDAAFVKVAQVELSEVPEAVTLSGKLAFDAEHLHLISSRVAGRLDRILLFEGAKVSVGQAVAELYSPEWISAQTEYLLARNTVRALATTKQTDLLEDAKFTEQSVINRMKVLGASDADVAQLSKTGVVNTHLALRAPIAGTVTQRSMDPGAFLNVGDNFMTVADTRRIWFIGNFYEQDYSKVKLGQTLELQVPALPGKTFKGTVNYIGTMIDPNTHTLPVRCTVDNSSGELRPELFGSATLTTGMRQVVVVPKSAIVSIKQASFVVVEREPGVYRRVPVTSITLVDGRVAVSSGLSGGERVVIEGATLVNESIGRS